MYILGIETSSDTGSVALASEKGNIQSMNFGKGQAHAKKILYYVDAMLRNNEVRKENVDHVAAAVGPGSFTGLRVGVTCAKTLSYALKWKAIGICSLEVLAWDYDPEDVACRYICPIKDARRKAVYGRVFQKSSSGWYAQGEVFMGSPETLSEKLPDDVMVFGSGVEAYPNVFSTSRFRQPEVTAPATSLRPKAENVAMLGRYYARAGQCVSPFSLIPRYYRLTAVEERVKREAKV